jgi:chloramphenicol O-acetyltransferase type A
LSVTAEVDISALIQVLREKNFKFFPSFSYIITKVVNGLPEFRHRISEGALYEYKTIDPAFTVLLSNNTFTFCDSTYYPTFQDYYNYTVQRIEWIKENPDLSNKNKDHMFFITNIPWMSFTSFTHPYLETYRSIPIVTIGKYFNRNGQVYIPIALQVDHAIMDGIHLGKFYEEIGHYCGEAVRDLFSS